MAVRFREGISNKELVDALDEQYRNYRSRSAHGKRVQAVRRVGRRQSPFGSTRAELLRTQFHVRAKTIGVVQLNNW